MISLTTSTKMTGRSVLAACPLGVSLRGTGLSSASRPAIRVLPVLPIRERDERPTQAPAVAAAAQAQAYAFAAAANGAGAGTAKAANAADGLANGQQKTQQHGMTWAFRGLEPWSDPA